MQVIKAERTQVTPEVILDLANNTLSLQGECYPENPLLFFTPIVTKLKSHLSQSNPDKFVARMHLQYVNSASTKGLQNIVAVLNDAGSTGTDIRLFWVHDPEDDALEELGADLVEDFSNVQLTRLHVA
jgi:hypothetical protein